MGELGEPLISVLVADDHSLIREGIRRVLEAEADLKLVAEAEDGREAVSLFRIHRPDVVLLDIRMPGLSGLEALEQIRSEARGVKAILLSNRGESSMVQSAVTLGADGYLLKTSQTGELPAAIRAVMRGGNYFSPVIAREIVEQVRHPSPEGPFVALSMRERQVLRGIAEGKSAKEIATELGISTKTTESHRTSLMRKLGIRKATELVRYAVRNGIVEP
jgi:DNA-binding NarL/FixJ family response regulator